MINVAIVEDDQVCVERLQAFLKKFEKENDNIAFSVTQYGNGKEFIDNYSSGKDIVFMDIEMPTMDGLKAAELLRQKDDDVILIFITHMQQYAIKGYEVSAFDFVIKPITYPSFSIKLKKAINNRKHNTNLKIQITTSDGCVLIPLSSIRYIDVIGHDLTYYTETDKYTERASLSDIEEKLKGCGFSRCSRYCLVNLHYITSVNDDYVILGEEKIPLSRRYKKPLMRDLLVYFGGGNTN